MWMDVIDRTTAFSLGPAFDDGFTGPELTGCEE